MTPTELRQIIANGESPTIEFKREFNTDIDRERLEVTNPGPLPARLNLDELIYQGGISFPRNPIIAGVMREWGFMEQVGRGLVHIRRQMQKLGSEEPLFKSTDVGFTVIFPSRHRNLST